MFQIFTDYLNMNHSLPKIVIVYVLLFVAYFFDKNIVKEREVVPKSMVFTSKAKVHDYEQYQPFYFFKRLAKKCTTVFLENTMALKLPLPIIGTMSSSSSRYFSKTRPDISW